MAHPLHDLPDDLVIYLFDLLPIPDILGLRQTCKRMQTISTLRIVWTNACKHQILSLQYPFPDVGIESLAVSELEHHVRHAYILASRWLSPNKVPPAVHSEFDATNGTPVSALRFVPGHAANWLLAVSSGIWSIIALWELSEPGQAPTKRCEWSRRNCVLQRFVLNDDPASAAFLAVSVIRGREHYIEVLSLDADAGFLTLCKIDSALNPLYFRGDILVLCDPIDISVVHNWKTGASATLRRQAGTETDMFLNDLCMQVVVTPACILIVRARSLYLFPNPPLTTGALTSYTPLAVHSFGWVDGVAVIPTADSTPDSNPTLSILIRPEPDDPWAAALDHALDLYLLPPNPAFPLASPIPYTFPPSLTARVPSARGSLQCSALRLGAHDTAVWVEPQNRSARGLLDDDGYAPQLVRQDERLVCAAFPGPLFGPRGPSAGDMDLELELDSDSGGPMPVRGRTLRSNELNNWKALDYDEVRGRIAIASTRGKITVLSLV
ncbi:hypothetical protein C8R46DRAFT_1006596 [Mycena filopes]|nr:hypothetical protein C8R46DRAFT_1006596 [Mycena filopes]